jgi:hypothetical protein
MLLTQQITMEINQLSFQIQEGFRIDLIVEDTIVDLFAFGQQTARVADKFQRDIT